MKRSAIIKRLGYEKSAGWTTYSTSHAALSFFQGAATPDEGSSVSRYYHFCRKFRIGFHFFDLFVVADVVQRNVDQPLVSVERVEDREGVIQRVGLQRQFGLFGEFQGLGARLFQLRDHLVSRQLA